MKAYSTREVADLLGIAPGRVRALVRSGVLIPQRGQSGRSEFSFQDLVLLRTAKSLNDAQVPARRVTRALQALARQLPTDKPLSAVRVQVDGSRVIVRDALGTWEPESRQTVLEFSLRDLAEKVAPMSRGSVECALRTGSRVEELFQAALESEHMGAVAEAEEAYRDIIAADTAHIAAHINLGRLRHVAKALDEAEALYRAALEIDANHATARFNLGVVLEDRGARAEALEQYRQAVRLDPRIADVHFNLARLYQQAGDQQAALRHFSRFKALTRERNE